MIRKIRNKFIVNKSSENFRMGDIEINALSSLFLNLETKLILYLYPEKCIQFNQLGFRSSYYFRIFWLSLYDKICIF